MPLVEVTLDIRADGKPVLSQPVVYSVTVVEMNNITLTKSGSDGASYLQWSQLATDNGFLAITDTAVNFKFNNAGAIPLTAGGLILILGANIAAGVATNVTINNNSGSVATIKGFEFGP